MTDKKAVSSKILQLRKQGYSYDAIASALGISKNTVASTCRRAGIVVDVKDVVKKADMSEKRCFYCGLPFENSWNRPNKRFCSSECHDAYWNEVRRKAYQNQKQKDQEVNPKTP